MFRAIFLVLTLILIGCTEEPIESILEVGDSVNSTLEASEGHIKWKFQTKTNNEHVSFFLTPKGTSKLIGSQLKVFMADSILCANLQLESDSKFGLSLIGPNVIYSVELIRDSSERVQSEYLFEVRPAAQTQVGFSQGSCTSLLTSLGVNGLIISSLNSNTNPQIINPSPYGSFRFSYDPSNAVAMRPHTTGARPTVQMGGGSNMNINLNLVSCEVNRFQLNLWDTEDGPKPEIEVQDQFGNSLCTPNCPANPAQFEWSSYTIQTEDPTQTIIAECEEVHFSSFVLLSAN